MNKAQIIGNLGKDPEVRTMQNGDRVCTLKIATSEAWRDRQTGERKEITEWHTVVIFNGKLVEVAEKYLRKGSKVYAEGQIKTRKWQDQEGKDRYMTEIVIGRFQGAIELLDRPKTDQAPVAPATDMPAGDPLPPYDEVNAEEIPF